MNLDQIKELLEDYPEAVITMCTREGNKIINMISIYGVELYPKDETIEELTEKLQGIKETFNSLEDRLTAEFEGEVGLYMDMPKEEAVEKSFRTAKMKIMTKYWVDMFITNPDDIVNFLFSFYLN